MPTVRKIRWPFVSLLFTEKLVFSSPITLLLCFCCWLDMIVRMHQNLARIVEWSDGTACGSNTLPNRCRRWWTNHERQFHRRFLHEGMVLIVITRFHLFFCLISRIYLVRGQEFERSTIHRHNHPKWFFLTPTSIRSRIPKSELNSSRFPGENHQITAILVSRAWWSSVRRWSPFSLCFVSFHVFFFDWRNTEKHDKLQ